MLLQSVLDFLCMLAMADLFPEWKSMQLNIHNNADEAAVPPRKALWFYITSPVFILDTHKLLF